MFLEQIYFQITLVTKELQKDVENKIATNFAFKYSFDGD